MQVVFSLSLSCITGAAPVLSVQHCNCVKGSQRSLNTIALLIQPPSVTTVIPFSKRTERVSSGAFIHTDLLPGTKTAFRQVTLNSSSYHCNQLMIQNICVNLNLLIKFISHIISIIFELFPHSVHFKLFLSGALTSRVFDSSLYGCYPHSVNVILNSGHN